jgi:hypothetical protein
MKDGLCGLDCATKSSLTKASTNSQADRGSKLWKTYHIVGQYHFAFILCPEG